MTSTGTATTAVEQAIVRLADDGTASVLASSLEVEQDERGWLGLIAPYLGFAELAERTSGTVAAAPPGTPTVAYSYALVSDGFAAVLRRTWDPNRPRTVETHALMGVAHELTPAVALSTSDWAGWRDAESVQRRLPILRLEDLRQDAAATQLRARALRQGDMLARSLAWLLQSPTTPLGLVGCPDGDRLALMWALLAIGGPELRGREWTFATCGDANGKPAAVTFFNAPPGPGVAPDRVVVDLGRGQGASPQNEYRANALVYRYEFGVDPREMSTAPVAPAPAAIPVQVAPVHEPYAPGPVQPGTMVPPAQGRSGLPPWRAEELVRDVVAARDERAVDGALVELEFAVAKFDDRDDVRRALERAEWAVPTIRKHVRPELRDAIFDRVARIAFGATGRGRVTPNARADARRLAADSGSVELVRAIARASSEADLADVLARRWLAEQEQQSTVDKTVPAWQRYVLIAIILVALLSAGLIIGMVIR